MKHSRVHIHLFYLAIIKLEGTRLALLLIIRNFWHENKVLRCYFLLTLEDKFLIEDHVPGEGCHVIHE